MESIFLHPYRLSLVMWLALAIGTLASMRQAKVWKVLVHREPSMAFVVHQPTGASLDQNYLANHQNCEISILGTLTETKTKLTHLF